MTARVVLPDAPPDIADRRLFAVDDIEFTVADVVRLARVGHRDLGASQAASAEEGPTAVQETFRRGRGLLTSDQRESWLARWAITPDEFVDWSASPDRATWAAYVCSGQLERDQAEVAAAAAAACVLGSAPASAGEFDPTGWVARLTAREVTDDALRAAIARHRLDWTRVRGAGAFATTRAVAEELRQWVLADGLDLSIAATQAGCPTYLVDGALDDLAPPTLRARVSGARAGELVGPVEAGPGWTVLRLDDRVEPDPADPETVARARARVATEVVERVVLRHVSA